MEVEYHVHLAQRLGYLSEEYWGLRESHSEGARALQGLTEYWEGEVGTPEYEPQSLALRNQSLI